MKNNISLEILIFHPSTSLPKAISFSSFSIQKEQGIEFNSTPKKVFWDLKTKRWKEESEEIHFSKVMVLLLVNNQSIISFSPSSVAGGASLLKKQTESKMRGRGDAIKRMDFLFLFPLCPSLPVSAPFLSKHLSVFRLEKSSSLSLCFQWKSLHPWMILSPDNSDSPFQTSVTFSFLAHSLSLCSFLVWTVINEEEKWWC